MSMDRHSGESRNPGALILKAILDPGFHRGDEKYKKGSYDTIFATGGRGIGLGLMNFFVHFILFAKKTSAFGSCMAVMSSIAYKF
jgi:hypothetical protein